VEGRYYREFSLPSPTLDVGCGDGQFVTTAFERPIEIGIDPELASLREAAQRKGYCGLVQSYGDRLPFPTGHFASAFSNSVLEHIPGVEAVVSEVGRVLRPGGVFVFCVPNHQFLSTLSIGRGLDRLGARRLGDAYRAFFNRIARHHHSDDPETWTQRLERAGFAVDRWWHYFPPAAQHTMEWGHYFGLPSLVAKRLTGRWVLAPTRWNLTLTDRIARRHYAAPAESPLGVCSFYVTHRKPYSTGRA
jgi:SAM-dependent methyltransferase